MIWFEALGWINGWQAGTTAQLDEPWRDPSWPSTTSWNQRVHLESNRDNKPRRRASVPTGPLCHSSGAFYLPSHEATSLDVPWNSHQNRLDEASTPWHTRSANAPKAPFTAVLFNSPFSFLATSPCKSGISRQMSLDGPGGEVSSLRCGYLDVEYEIYW